jgi:hypothetical protein
MYMDIFQAMARPMNEPSSSAALDGLGALHVLVGHGETQQERQQADGDARPG